MDSSSPWDVDTEEIDVSKWQKVVGISPIGDFWRKYGEDDSEAERVCTCGSAAVYGPSATIHSSWCDILPK